MHRIIFFLSENSISKIQFPYSGQRLEDILGRKKQFNISFSPHYPNLHYLLCAVFWLQNYLPVSMILSKSNLGALETLVTFFFPSSTVSCQWEQFSWTQFRAARLDQRRVGTWWPLKLPIAQFSSFNILMSLCSCSQEHGTVQLLDPLTIPHCSRCRTCGQDGKMRVSHSIRQMSSSQ